MIDMLRSADVYKDTQGDLYVVKAKSSIAQIVLGQSIVPIAHRYYQISRNVI